jgi:tRNA 2-selenouridine synthase
MQIVHALPLAGMHRQQASPVDAGPSRLEYRTVEHGMANGGRRGGTVGVAQLDEFDEVIDVRSPAEFAIDHVPGAVNCPTLDNEERARVGTIYKQVSAFEARKVGAALVARNVARHLETQFCRRDKGWKPLVYCWRGGKRSASMAHVLREVGWAAATLDGGYQNYRRAVLAQLEELPARLTWRVLCGPTGSGKSRLLQARAARGAQVLDLEALAQHRGSVLGDMPGAPQPSQKMFDSLVWHSLRQFDAAHPVFAEAESRKIGAVRVPERLLTSMRASTCLRVQAPLAERVRFLLAEYRDWLEQPDWLKTQLLRLAALHSRETLARWLAQIDARDWDALVADLLVTHYDPAYLRSMGKSYPSLGDTRVLELPRLDEHALDAATHALIAR